MRTMTAAFAVSTALIFQCTAGSSPIHAREAAQPRLIVRVPIERPYWDSYIVPRYRYRPEDDRVDPYGPPVVPVIRYGPQEIVLPSWRW